MRMIWLAIGWGSVAAAFVGVWLPLVPTVPFLLVALWAFARGSPELRTWLLEHPRFGRMLHDWHVHGAIPMRGKLLSVFGMVASYLVLLFTTDLPHWVFAMIAGLFLAIMVFVVSRPAPIERR